MKQLYVGCVDSYIQSLWLANSLFSFNHGKVSQRYLQLMFWKWHIISSFLLFVSKRHHWIVFCIRSYTKKTLSVMNYFIIAQKASNELLLRRAQKFTAVSECIEKYQYFYTIHITSVHLWTYFMHYMPLLFLQKTAICMTVWVHLCTSLFLNFGFLCDWIKFILRKVLGTDQVWKPFLSKQASKS